MPGSSREELEARAAEELARIDRQRETALLVAQGFSDEQIARYQGIELRLVVGVRADVEAGVVVRPVTPYEVGLRRAVGQMSTEEMMRRLRLWPYTFGRVMYDAWSPGSWDDIDRLDRLKYITDMEYAELRAIADQLPPGPEDVGIAW